MIISESSPPPGPWDTGQGPQDPQQAPASEPAINVPRVVLAVVGVLCAIHVALWALGDSWQAWSLYMFSFIPSRVTGGEAVAYPHGAQVWSFLTYAFLHADAFHLGSNSVWLLVFSTPVARRLGAWRYLAFLAVTAVAGALAVMLAHWGKALIVVGASASVSGVLAGAIPVMFSPLFSMRLKTEQQYRALPVLRITQVIRMPGALGFAGLFLALTFFSGVTQMLSGTAFLEERSVAWEAHLAGFVVGFFCFYLLDRKWVPPEQDL